MSLKIANSSSNVFSVFKCLTLAQFILWVALPHHELRGTKRVGLNDPLPCALLYLYFFGKLFIHFCFCFKGFWVDPHFKDQHKVLIRFFFSRNSIETTHPQISFNKIPVSKVDYQKHEGTETCKTFTTKVNESKGPLRKFQRVLSRSSPVHIHISLVRRHLDLRSFNFAITHLVSSQNFPKN